MYKSTRRAALTVISSAAFAAGVTPTWGQPTKKTPPAALSKVKAKKLASKLRLVIPANTGGGWDQTGRALGAALVNAGVTEEIEYENKGGKGGTVGLAHYVEKYNSDPNTLMMGGMVMVGAVALQKPAIDMTKVAALARLTSDYLVVVVAADSPVRNINDLAEKIRIAPKNVPIAGGGSGGIDHVFAGVFLKAARGDPQELAYLPFTSGKEVGQAVVSGTAVAGVSGYSEFSDEISTGKLRAIGVSSKRTSFGVPAIREQGINVEMANWRGVFTGQGVASARQTELLEGIKAATSQASWQQVLKQNRWEPSWLAETAFNSFIDVDLTTFRVMIHLLKLKN
jgi:putative tricarboxylic transport membrane protein